MKKLNIYVSAATRGVGFAIASRFVQDGHDIAICGRNFGRVEDARRRLAEVNPASSIRGYVADIADRKQQSSLLNSMDKDGFHPDVYVCNTGQPTNTCLADLDRDKWDHDMEKVVGHAVFAAQQFVPKMVEKGYGRFVFISSTYAKAPSRDFLVGSIARGGLFVLSKALVAEYASLGVASFVVGLGYVDTPLLRNMALERDYDAPDPALGCTDAPWSKQFTKWSKTIPARKIGSTEELAEVVRFLASPAAEYLNGNVLSFSGGLDRSIV